MGKKTNIRWAFVLVMFFIMMITLITISLGGTYLYMVNVGRDTISDIEKNRKDYFSTLANTLTVTAELSYKTRHYGGLRDIFRKRIDSDGIYNAFFVLGNGNILVNSSKERYNEVSGNIANDEFSYNLDLILKPLKKKSNKLMVFDYNIMGRAVPFDRQYRYYIKKYLYKDINKLGWLMTKAVVVKGKYVGTVSFIVDKGEIYRFIKDHIDTGKKIVILDLIISFAISFLTMLAVYIKIGTIKPHEDCNKTKKVKKPIKKSVMLHDFSNDNELVTIEVLGNIDDGIIDDESGEEILNIEKNKDEFIVEDLIVDETEVLDAIPIEKRG